MSTLPPAVRTGLGAVAKSGLLVFGVPLALVRLWALTTRLPSGSTLLDEGLWIRIVLLVVGILWLRATYSLLAELRRAIFEHRPVSGASWSSRWAGAIAGLVLLASATHLLGAPSSTRVITTEVTMARVQSTTNASGSTAVIANNECLADTAERLLGDRSAWVELALHNLDALQLSGERFVDPNLVRAGWCLKLPDAATSTGRPGPTRPSHRAARPVLDELALLGLGVLTTTALVRRLRALSLSARTSREPGQRLRRGDPELEAVESAIEPFGSAPLLQWIEVANRLLRRIALQRGVAPEVRLVRAGPGGITVFLEQAIEGSFDPFVVSANGRCWTLPLTTPLAALQRETEEFGRLVPWLVPLGDDGLDAWLLAVGPRRRLVIVGDEERTTAVLNGIVVAFRTLPWAEELQVELVGIDPPPIEERCYQIVASSSAALGELAGDVREPRRSRSTPSWRREPLVVAGVEVDEDAFADDIQFLAGVICANGSGTDRLVLQGDFARIEPHGLELRVPEPDRHACRLIERLLDRAAIEPLFVPVSAPAPRTPDRASPSQSDPTLRISLLGERATLPAIEGRVAARDRARVVELLAYLVLHGGTASEADLLKSVFARSGPSAPARLADLIGAGTAALRGQLSSGRRALVVRNGSVTIDGAITCDWSELLAALAAARTSPPGNAKQLLHDVLLDEPRPPHAGYSWLESQGHVAELSFSLCDAWHQLALLALAEGDHVLAERAVRAGLRVEPTSELLFRDLMIVRGVNHDRRGVIASYEELELALGSIGGLEPSEETRRLFDELATSE